MNKIYKKDKKFRRLVDPKNDTICLTTTIHPTQNKKNKKCC